MRATRAGLLGPCFGAGIALVLAGLFPIDNPDTFGHLAAGRQVVELGSVPRLDSFSYFRETPQPWVNYEWLSDRLAFAAYAAGGFEGLNLGKAVLLLALGALLAAGAYLRGGPRAATCAALLVALAVPATRFRLSPRPHLFGLVLGALYLIGLTALLEAARPGGPHDKRRIVRWVAGLGLAHVLWVNLHGSHLFGLALTALACTVSCRMPLARNALLALLGLELAACCISPYGPAIVVDAIAHVFDPRYRELVSEWRGWRPDQPLWFALALALQALLTAAAWRRLPAGPVRPFVRASLLLLLVMGVRSLRFLPDCLLLGAPLLAEAFARAPEASTAARARGPRRIALGLGLGAIVCAGAVWLTLRLPPYAAFGLGVDTRSLPAASAAWLNRERPEARVFSSMDDGWYLMFAAPSVKLLLDGRVPFYGAEHVTATLRAFADPAALQTLLQTSRTDSVLLQPARADQQSALAALRADPSYALVMIENRHALFIRGASSAALQVLVPGYEPRWILAEAEPARIRRELARLRPEPNAAAYVAWVDALLAMRPLARAAGDAGFAPPTSEAQRSAAVSALSKLRPLKGLLESVPSIDAYYALAAVSACRLDEAQAVLDAIPQQDTSREALFARQELSLRRGETDPVRDFIAQAEQLEAARGDPWLAALRSATRSPPLCD